MAARVQNGLTQRASTFDELAESLLNVLVYGVEDEQEAEEKQVSPGYQLSRGALQGKALLQQRKQHGIELVKRLKDANGALADEVTFWGEQLAWMIQELHGRDPFGIVTNPPSSCKRPYSLCARLAKAVARELDSEYAELFVNETPRRHKASMQEKLREAISYSYLGDYSVPRVLVVDDAMCTGRTAQRCIKAAPGISLYFAVLCGP